MQSYFFLFLSAIDIRYDQDSMYTFSNHTSPTQCINITIVDDTIVEDTEAISLQLYSLGSSTNVLLTEKAICTIFIEDNDCK